MIEFRTHRSIRDIPRAEWDALLGEDPPPHSRWEFFEAFECTGCVGARAGWIPCPITLSREQQLLAIAPAYIKTNSDGEFVFDHSWARFSEERLRLPYYPKLILAVPFTPASGPRVLVGPSAAGPEVFAALNTGLQQLSHQLEVSSVHILLPEPAQVSAFLETDLDHRYGLQYHWRNAGYCSFDDFLSRFSAKRRHQIRHERRALERQNIQLEVITGSDWSPRFVDLAYTFYTSTVHKYFWGRQYLNRQFFEHLCHVMKDALLMVVAKERGTKNYVGGAFNLVGGGALYGRYWGAVEEREFLHFNVCYYKGIEECIARKLTLFEPGAGGGHKQARGFEPTVTHSFHYIRHPAFREVIHDFLERERAKVDEYLSQERPVLKPLT